MKQVRSSVWIYAVERLHWTRGLCLISEAGAVAVVVAVALAVVAAVAVV